MKLQLSKLLCCVFQSAATSGGPVPMEPPGAGDAAAARPVSGGIPKKKPEDFIFGKVIGEGSYSTVSLANK